MSTLDPAASKTPSCYSVAVAELSDELDLVTAAALETRLNEALEDFLQSGPATRRTFEIDLTGVRLLSSAGITVVERFLGIARAQGVDARLRLTEGSPPHRVMKILGLLDRSVQLSRRR